MTFKKESIDIFSTLASLKLVQKRLSLTRNHASFSIKETAGSMPDIY